VVLVRRLSVVMKGFCNRQKTLKSLVRFGPPGIVVLCVFVFLPVLVSGMLSMSLRGGCPLPFIYYTYGNDVCGPARENENTRKKEREEMQ
jgi:hypothetical protein